LGVEEQQAAPRYPESVTESSHVPADLGERKDEKRAELMALVLSRLGSG